MLFEDTFHLKTPLNIFSRKEKNRNRKFWSRKSAPYNSNETKRWIGLVVVKSSGRGHRLLDNVWERMAGVAKEEEGSAFPAHSLRPRLGLLESLLPSTPRLSLSISFFLFLSLSSPLSPSSQYLVKSLYLFEVFTGNLLTSLSWYPMHIVLQQPPGVSFLD